MKNQYRWRMAASVLTTLSAAALHGNGFAQVPAPVVVSTATLHPADIRQPMIGFGGSQTYAGDELANFRGRDAVYKALFQDLKIDIYRLRNYHDYPGQQAKYEQITREFGGAALKWGKDSKARGGKAPVRLMFTSWSPPPRLKSNGLVSGRSDGTDHGLENGTLKTAPDGKIVYDQFANWWLNSLQNFKKLTGSYPDYIALQNELDFAASYEGCLFLPTESTIPTGDKIAGYDRALKAVSDKLVDALGKSSPKIIGPETFSTKTSAADRNHVLKYVNPQNPVGAADLTRLDGVSFHIYGAGGVSTPGQPADLVRFKAGLNEIRNAYRSGGYSKPLFETEYLEGESLTAEAGIISDTITEGDVSAYLVWIAARSVKQPGGYALVYYNPDDGSVERRGRFYAVKAFSEFVGEGWHRIESSSTDNALKLSAFVGPRNDELVAVLVNPTAEQHRVSLGIDDEKYRSAVSATFRSSEGETGEHWKELGPLPTDNVVTLTPHSVVTVKFAARGTDATIRR